jgi:hypothetical protein
MAKKAKPAEQEGAANGPAGGEGEPVQAYFRRIFEANPKLLRVRSNQKLLDQWLADHPDATEVPKNVKVGLQNIKGVMRSQKRKRKKAKAAAAAGPDVQPQRPAPKKNVLERLEEQIDDCLTFARDLENEGLESVISHLRRARNEVVWKLGQ